MSTEHTRYDIFVSYAHADDVGGWVQALCKRIEQDQLSFSRERLEIFHDRKIRSMDDWEHRILGALRHSRVLLVCLSPAYFASKYCKGEWEEYVRRQVPRPGGPGSIAGVYFVEVPGEGTSEDPWHRAAFVPQLTDVRPWFPDGAAAIANEVVAGRLRELGMSLWERIQRAHRADLPAGNIRRQTPYFVGRTEEMRRLHQQVSKNAVGLLAAVHGIGGQGKTELAVAYAHSFADQYPAGLWWLGAEGKTQLLPLLAELAFAPELGYQPSEIERKDPALLGRGVIAELGRRARAAHERDPNGGSAALVVLDNVSEPALLSSVQLASLPRADWLRLIATTRLGPDSLHAPASALGFVTVDSLDVDDALALMREHQPARDPAGLMPAFVSAAETAAARELAQELGGLTLAVEQVAVHLGLHPEVTPSALLAALREKGLTSVDRLGGREAVADQILHEEKRMAIVLEETLGALDAPTRIALGFAALLPPDVVPWAWLKSLTLIHHPELDQVVPDEPDPWLVVRRRLEGLRLITSGAILEVGRIHRVIAAHVAEGADRARLRPQLLAYLAGRTRAMSQASALTDEWNLDALLTTLPFELVRGDEAAISSDEGAISGDLASATVYLAMKVLAYRPPSSLSALLAAALPVLERCSHADPSNPAWRREISVCHNVASDVLSRQGHIEAALDEINKSLAIVEGLVEAEPGNDLWQHDLNVTLNRAGDARLALGDTAAALTAYGRSLSIVSLRLVDTTGSLVHNQSFRTLRELLVQVVDALARDDLEATVDRHLALASILKESAFDVVPSNLIWFRALGRSLRNFGAILHRQGRLDGARATWREASSVLQRVLAVNPTDTEVRQELPRNHVDVGDVLQRQGNLEAALDEYREALALLEDLVKLDPANGMLQWSLSDALARVGDVLRTQRNLEGAQQQYRRSLPIIGRLAATDPTNVGMQWALSDGFSRLGDVLQGQKNPSEALREYRQSLAVIERLAEASPTSLDLQRRLTWGHTKVGNALLAQGELDQALSEYRESLTRARSLVDGDPNNTGTRWDLSSTYRDIGQVLERQGNLEAALSDYQESSAIMRHLTETDPANLGLGRDLSWTRCLVGDVLQRLGNLEAAWAEYGESLAFLERAATVDPANEGLQRELSWTLERCGDALWRQGDLEGALKRFRAWSAIMERLEGADPTNASLLWEHAAAHDRCGRLLQELGKPEDALAEHREALAAAERLVSAEPSNPSHRQALSWSHGKVGDLLLQLGNPEQGLIELRAALAIMEQLVAESAENRVWQWGLAVSLLRLGDALVEHGNQPEAQASYQRALAILDAEGKADPTNVGLQVDLAVGHLKVGVGLRRQGRFEEAADAFRRVQAVRQSLADAHPTDPGFQHSLAEGPALLGETLQDAGDLIGALGSYRSALTISQRLATGDPTCAGCQRDLAVLSLRIAEVLEAQSQPGEALPWWHKGLERFTAMEQQGLFIAPHDREELAKVRRRFNN